MSDVTSVVLNAKTMSFATSTWASAELRKIPNTCTDCTDFLLELVLLVSLLIDTLIMTTTGQLYN